MNTRNSAQLLRGCKFAPLSIHDDRRGKLSVLELNCIAGFVAQRIFIISVDADQTNAVRAEHSTSSAEALLVLAGSVHIDLDNGSAQQSVILDSTSNALIIGAGVWRRLHTFAANTLIVALSPESYELTKTFPVPQPDLITGLDQ